MNDASGRQKLAPRTSALQGVTVADSRGWLTRGCGGAWISRHPFPCVGSASLLGFGCCSFALVLSQCPGSASLYSRNTGGTLLFSLSCSVVGLEGRVRRSTQPLSSASASGLADSGQSHPALSLSFSSSSLPSHSPKTHDTRLLPSSSRRHLPGRRAFRSLALVVSAIFLARPQPAILPC